MQINHLFQVDLILQKMVKTADRTWFCQNVELKKNAMDMKMCHSRMVSVTY